jgi:HD-GYP domain-containing protein (c-di-GMP phosphodiesterase class II)
MTTSPRPAMPPRIRLFVAGTAALAIVLAPLSRLAPGSLHSTSALLAAIALIAMIAAAGRRSVRIGPKRQVSVGTAPTVAAVLLLPGPLAVAVLAAATLAGQARLRAPAVQWAFNTAVAVMKAAAAALVYTVLRSLAPAAIAEPAAAVGAAAVMYATGEALVIGIAAVQLRENPLPRAWAAQRDTVVVEVALMLTGIMSSLAAERVGWGLLLLIAPVAITYRALRDGVALQAQTRLALEDLADIVDMRDHYTYEHSRRVAELARATARRLRLSAEEVELVTMAARVHDVGKIGIKSTVLMKPGRLTDREWHEMRSHPEVGARLIGNFPQFARGRDLVRHHHERFDGKGYPDGLAGDRIPLGARILAVADAWDAMTSHRAYRRALDLDHVRDEMRRCSGSQFDPEVLAAFMEVVDERPDLATPAVQVVQDVDMAAPAEQPAPVAA